MISILLVDDQPVVRQGLRMRLALEPDVEVVGEAGDGERAVYLAGMLHPTVVVMDIEMPGMDGLVATALVSKQEHPSAVVILSLYDDAATRGRALLAGAAAVVGKHETTDTLLAVIRRAADPAIPPSRADQKGKAC